MTSRRMHVPASDASLWAALGWRVLWPTEYYGTRCVLVEWSGEGVPPGCER